MEYDFSTKNELINKLLKYATEFDDENIRFKEAIKAKLLSCPELLYALHNVSYENELFDDEGNLIEDGDWSIYFNDNIRPYLFFPEVQTEIKNFLSYTINFNESPRYNELEKYVDIVFVVLVDGKDPIDKTTGIARHDLISSILRENFNWSNVFGTQCKLVSNKESSTDSQYITRTMIFEMTIPNSILNKNKVYNYKVNR